MSEEIWKKIPGFENHEASSLGRFKCAAHFDSRGRFLPLRLLAQQKHKKGYMHVRLSGRTYQSHRMIALALYGASDLPMVNHINGVRHDNRPENLEWCTASENVRHAIKHGSLVYKGGIDANSSRGWIQAEKDGFGLMLRGCQDLLAEGLNPSNVSSCLKGTRQTCRGFSIARIPHPTPTQAPARWNEERYSL